MSSYVQIPHVVEFANPLLGASYSSCSSAFGKIFVTL